MYIWSYCAAISCAYSHILSTPPRFEAGGQSQKSYDFVIGQRKSQKISGIIRTINEISDLFRHRMNRKIERRICSKKKTPTFYVVVQNDLRLSP